MKRSAKGRDQPLEQPEEPNRQPDRAAKTAGAQDVSRDVIERRRADEAVFQLAAIVESSEDAIISETLDGIIISWSGGAERMYGYTAEEVQGRSIALLVPPDRPDELSALLEKIKKGERVLNHETERLRKDGGRIDVSLTIWPIRNGAGKVISASVIAREITGRKQAEQELQRSNSELAAWVQELEQRATEMTLLNEMGDLLRACLTVDEAYTAIVPIAKQLFSPDSGALCVITGLRHLAELVAVWGPNPPEERLFKPEACWALRRGRVHQVENSQHGLICKHLSVPLPAAYLCVPMMAQGDTLGMLHLSVTGSGRLTVARRSLVVTLAEHLSLAISNLKLQETLHSQAIRDPLTGLFNRRFMEESLEREVRRAERNQRLLGIIMIDLDNFKNFNDTFGHDAGDTLLRELGSLLQSKVRGEDIACRYGGEEFTLILPESTIDGTRQRAEQIRGVVKRLKLRHRDHPLGRVTISVGIAMYPNHGPTGEDVLRAADEALYRAKAEGRDRVVVAD